MSRHCWSLGVTMGAMCVWAFVWAIGSVVPKPQRGAALWRQIVTQYGPYGQHRFDFRVNAVTAPLQIGHYVVYHADARSVPQVESFDRTNTDTQLREDAALDHIDSNASSSAHAPLPPQRVNELIRDLRATELHHADDLLAEAGDHRVTAACPIIYNLLRTHPTARDARLAFYVLGSMNYRPSARLAEQALSRNATVRSAAFCLGRTGSVRDLSALTNLLSAAIDPESYTMVERSLGHLLGGYTAAPNASNANPATHHEVLTALQRLTALCDDPDLVIRRAALNALGDATQSGAPECIACCRKVYAKVPANRGRDALIRRVPALHGVL